MKKILSLAAATLMLAAVCSCNNNPQDTDEAKLMAAQLEKVQVTIPVKIGEGGKLFGSVTGKDVSDALKKENQVATFFVVGCRVKEFKSMILRENAQGCEIASHTYNHQILTRCGAEKLKTEMEDTETVLTEVLGFGSTIMRPPGGAVNDSVKANMEKPMIIWSVDTRDWATRNVESTKKAVLDNIKDGDIVLMHDLYEATAKASQDIIPALVKKGYQLVTVSELAELRGKKLENGKTYFSIR